MNADALNIQSRVLKKTGKIYFVRKTVFSGKIHNVAKWAGISIAKVTNHMILLMSNNK